VKMSAEETCLASSNPAELSSRQPTPLLHRSCPLEQVVACQHAAPSIFPGMTIEGHTSSGDHVTGRLEAAGISKPTT